MMKSQGFAIFVVSFLLILLAAKCGRNEPPAAGNVVGELPSQATKSPVEKGAVAYPAIDGAAYYILNVKPGARRHVIATTRRDGPSGTNYTRREYICGANAFRYLAEAETKAELDAKPDEEGPFAELVASSSSYLAGQAACKLAQ
jgi:hypothetical protein